jgi:hypothetical protein
MKKLLIAVLFVILLVIGAGFGTMLGLVIKDMRFPPLNQVERTIACKDYVMRAVEISERLGVPLAVGFKDNSWFLETQRDPGDKYGPTSKVQVVCNGDTGELRYVPSVPTGEGAYGPPPKAQADIWIRQLRRKETVVLSALVAALPNGAEVDYSGTGLSNTPISATLYPVWRTNVVRNPVGWGH